MKKWFLFAVLLLGVLLPAAALLGGSSRADCVSPTFCFPPGCCGFTSTDVVQYRDGLALRGFSLHDFTHCFPYDESWETLATLDVVAQLDFDLSVDGGSTWTAYRGIGGSGLVTVRGGLGGDRFTTQLDYLSDAVHAGDFGDVWLYIVMSMGEVTFMPEGNGYRVVGFYDISSFLKDSSGQTHYPNPQLPFRTTLTPFGPTPARASTWGAIKALYR